MKNRTSAILVIISIFTFTLASAQVKILSGPDGGSYHQFVENMKTFLNEDGEVMIINHKTNGAANNFSQLIDANTDFKVAMMQMDYLNYMKIVDTKDNTENTSSIKVLVPLASEEIHLITTEKNYLKSIHMLKDRIIGIGDKSQGTYVTATFIKERTEIFWSSRNYHFDEAMKQLIRENIEAFFFVGSAPVEKLDLSPEVMADQLALVPLENFNGWADYYEPMTITTEDYKWLKEDVPTFGVRNVLVVNEAKLTDSDRAQLKKLVEALHAKLPALQEEGHPKWKEVDLDDWDSSIWPSYK